MAVHIRGSVQSCVKLYLQSRPRGHRYSRILGSCLATENVTCFTRSVSRTFCSHANSPNSVIECVPNDAHTMTEDIQHSNRDHVAAVFDNQDNHNTQSSHNIKNRLDQSDRNIQQGQTVIAATDSESSSEFDRTESSIARDEQERKTWDKDYKKPCGNEQWTDEELRDALLKEELYMFHGFAGLMRPDFLDKLFGDFKLCPSRKRETFMKTRNRYYNEDRLRRVRGSLNTAAVSKYIEGRRSGEINFARQKTMLHLSTKTLASYVQCEGLYASQYGPHLVIDMSFGSMMSKADSNSLMYQISTGLGYNRQHKNPFHIHITDINDTDRPNLTKVEINDMRIDVTLTDQSYDELYPQKSLIYLSPDARDVMKEYDPNAVYIIGGLVDTTGATRHTYSKAQRQGIRMQKLPIDVYHTFQGSKALTIDQVISILVDKKQNKSWDAALLHIPRRKIQGSRFHNKRYT